MKISEKWLTMALLFLSGGMIYWFPFFTDIFYVPVEEAFGFSNTQIGILLSTFGAVSMLTYVPGGWLADRFSPRKLITIALVTTALGGLPSLSISIRVSSPWADIIAVSNNAKIILLRTLLISTMIISGMPQSYAWYRDVR